ncbi:phasin family protein [Caballeronia arvi]|uniref:Phasin family protein n=1 Tax=Caballeronia arvi TaxID=1777135 RepID=A0A158KYJ3_9BURK|nr:phasin family protein [Caballeronia arvi]SAL85783.1 phasin family protein [Caballeronia arvi]
MIQLTPEQFAVAQKASLDGLFGLTGKLVEGLVKVTELNQQTIRSTLAEAQEHLQKTLSAKDPQEQLALLATLAGRTPEKLVSYNRLLFGIGSATQVECVRLAQAQCETYDRQVKTLVDDVASNAPAGSEAALAAWKSAITATSALLETLQKSGEQAVEVAGSNFEIVADVASTSARRAAESRSNDAKR